MTYRIYMAGAVDAHADLGRHWRKPLAAAIRARGWEPVWPTSDLQRVDEVDEDALADAIRVAQSSWDLRAIPVRDCNAGKRGPLYCLTALATCDGVVFVFDNETGLGTDCERAFALWSRIPCAGSLARKDSPASFRFASYHVALDSLSVLLAEARP